MAENNIINKKDFVEMDFTAKIKDTSEVFDSNKKADLEKAGLLDQIKAEPFVFSVGQGMFLPGVDEFLEGKEVGKSYTIELPFDKAFGKRDPTKIKVVPTSNFKGQQYQPMPGMRFDFDGQVGKVLSVSGGRVRVDFNHPVAGRDVIYEVEIKKKVEDLDEKIKNFSKFLFRADFDFLVDKEKKKVSFKIPKALEQLKQFILAFDKKFSELFDLGVEIEEISDEDFKKSLESKGKEGDKKRVEGKGKEGDKKESEKVEGNSRTETQ